MLTNQRPVDLGQMYAERTEAESGLGPWTVYVLVWGVLAAVGVAFYWLGVSWIAISLIILPITLVGIGWRPMFGLALMAALMPFAMGLTAGGRLTVERGLGILFAFGAAANILITRKHLRLLNAPSLTLFALLLVSVLSITWAIYPERTRSFAQTVAQIGIYVVLILCLVQDRKDLHWPLRIFVASCVLTLLLARTFGATTVTQRFTIATSPEAAMNPNAAGAMFGLGFFTAVYLFREEKSRWIRLAWLAAAAILPVGVLLTGARKATFFLAVPLILPLLSPRLIARRPRVFFGLAALLVLAAGMAFLAYKYVLPEGVAHRFINVDYAIESFNFRYALVREVVDYVSKHPLGAGMGSFFTSAGAYVHNDLFFLLGSLGFTGFAIFATFAVTMLVGVWRMPSGITRWYAGSLVMFLLLIGLGGTYVFSKYFWFFMSVAWLMRAAPSPIPRAPSGSGMPGHVLQSR